MQKFKCVIVEDEPIASEILEDYIHQIPFLQLAAKCEDAMDAIQVLQNEKIDLMFLDIHLPKLKGLDFIKTLKSPPKVIITTAYQQYALEGYEHSVIDYLLKPIEFDRFVKAVNRTREFYNESNSNERKSVFFNVNHKMVKVYLNEILFIESQQEYIKIITQGNVIVTKYQIGEIEKLLPAANFIRIHRSFIISKEKIDSYSALEIEICGNVVPIGRRYKDQIIKMLT